MSSRPAYGRNPYRRGFSDKVSGINQFVSGDAHFQSVRDANRGRGTIDIHPQSYNHRPPPQFDPRLPYSDFRPPQYSHRTQHPQRFHQNQSFRPPASYHNQQFRPQFQNSPLQDYSENQQGKTQFRNQKPLDYRNWEYAKTRPPPECDRFSILSYNILADYLAIDHRNKLYFHIPHHIMDWEWRKRNILFELGLWSADVLCLQEVDRFHDLEEELKVRGYFGTWKMRTGNPVDGCAIFWRFSRFKLLHEESIEFNKLGLRDNVAQICVLERINQNVKGYKSAVPTSTGGSSKIVVGNIHVLYNPRRGEIKLGQVRVLLDRAYAVSKLWDDAPVVLCGDFNSTPKSPLYNYISEQELELSGLPRDKLSGQAAAEIRSTRSFSPNLRTHTVDSQAMIHDREGKHYNNYHHASIMTDDSKVRQSETPSNTQKDNDIDINNENAAARKDDSVSHCIDSVLPDSSELSSNGRHSDEERSDNDEAGVYDHLEDLDLHVGNSSVDESHKMHPVLLSKDGMNQTLSVHSHDEDTCSNVMSSEQEDLKASDNQCSELHQSDFCDKNDYTPNGSTRHMLSLSVTDKKSILPTTLEVNIPVVSTSEWSPQVGDPDLNNNYVDGVRTNYNPSAWTPMEIETATGSADSTHMKSPLKLISTYSEVEDSSGTRDTFGEPVVTSYNRCFLGAVDYIWRSEGLQTVKVLAPVPKHAMQWTNGFPTKKWGSDHIALVSELAFTKDVGK